MTTQALDTIYYRGSEYLLADEPLGRRGRLPEFMAISTANHRGYAAVWAIVADRLFIVSLSGCVPDVDKNGLELVFPEAQAPVLADWFSGDLRLLSGRQVGQGDFELEYEHETLLTLGMGTVTGSRSISRKYSSTGPLQS